VKAPSPARLYLLLALMLAFWSFNYVVGKVALRELPPLFLTGLRTGLAGLIMCPIYLFRKPPHQRDVWKWREFRTLALLGLCGVVVNQMFFVLGLARTSVAHAAIVIALTPMLVLLMAVGVGQERLKAFKAAGMLIALAGVVVLQLGKKSGTSATALGDFLVLLAALTFAVFTVAGKTVTKRYGPVTVNTFAYVGGGLLLLPLTLWEGSQTALRDISALAWLSVFYMAAFASVLAYLIYYYALTHAPASRVSALSYLQPLLATLMAIPILHEPVTTPLVAGGALVLAGVYVTERG
jgi:drug/metabolite transporter (DMT)-like permease